MSNRVYQNSSKFGVAEEFFVNTYARPQVVSLHEGINKRQFIQFPRTVIYSTLYAPTHDVHIVCVY